MSTRSELLMPGGPDWVALHLRLVASGEGAATPLGLVRLRHWPDLGQVPDRFVAPVVRICALLWRKPTASHLVARVLGGDRNETTMLLKMLQELGHVEVVTIGDEPAGRRDDSGAAEAAARPAGMAAFFSKLRQRLLG